MWRSHGKASSSIPCLSPAARSRAYLKGIIVSDADTINIVRDAFHDEWNYTIDHPG
jgi:hypothetical protein